MRAPGAERHGALQQIVGDAQIDGVARQRHVLRDRRGFSRGQHALQLPIASEPTEVLALGALPRALAAGMSGYDALYLVLADATDATLVTADRRLAEAASRAELIP